MDGARTVTRTRTKTLTKTCAVVLPVLLLWLICWIVFAWGAVQDDAFIHLRYADNLYFHHVITYDGVHPNYGASSLLYVSGLALLRGLTASPDLPHAVSSVMHLLLFGGLAVLLVRIARTSETAGRAGLILLLLLSTPSAVRWLDDGMETVAVVGLVSLLAYVIHSEMYGQTASRTHDAALALLSFLAVLLRVELSLVCVAGFFLLTVGRATHFRKPREIRWRSFGSAALKSLHLLIGCGLGLATIYYTMHFLLPDTALAKSHGIAAWFNPLHDTVHTLAGAFSFGIGLFFFWVLTAILVRRRHAEFTAVTMLANGLFPVLLIASVIRGQEIQGVRYFAWTFVFSSLWNILELGGAVPEARTPANGRWSDMQLMHFFAGLIVLILPLEGVMMFRVLRHRKETLRVFESQRLEVLQGSRGVASDIGYIGYFTNASLCDLAGLVNGRAAGALSSRQRIHACAGTDPDFVFVSMSQLSSIAPAMDFSGWQMCGSYDFTNVTHPDSHYLLVRPAIADQVCKATGRAPESINTLLPSADVLNGTGQGRFGR